MTDNKPEEPQPSSSNRLPPLRSLGNPLAQYLWGRALVETGCKHRDPELIRKGWAHLQMARQEARKR
jgi:hypothetical protein